MTGENHFVQRRRLQKQELQKIAESNPDLVKNQIIVIFAKRTGLKHSTISVMLDEIELENSGGV